MPSTSLAGSLLIIVVTAIVVGAVTVALGVSLNVDAAGLNSDPALSIAGMLPAGLLGGLIARKLGDAGEHQAR